MKILMLTPYLPYPPESGGQIRTFNLLKYLSKHNQVTLICLYKNEKEKQYASYLKSFCHEIFLCKRPERPWQLSNILKAALSLIPFLIVRNYSIEAYEIIRDLLKKEQFDVIHAETFYIMPHIPKTDIPIFLVEQTIEYKVYQHYVSVLPILIRWILYLDILKLKYWESYYWKKATVVSSVSDYDKNIIQSLTPEIKPVIIPNGAGDEMFVKSLEKKPLDKPVMLFVGNFYWLQNVEAANYLINKLYPALKKTIPEIKLIIAGQNTSRKITFKSNEDIQIINIGDNDSDLVKKLYHNSTIFIAPIFGPGGTRLKILAAMAAGLPVISTQVGVEGLSVEHNKHVLIANNSDEFIKELTRMLNNPDLYEKLRKEAYKLAKEKFSWKSITNDLEKVYKEIHENRN